CGGPRNPERKTKLVNLTGAPGGRRRNLTYLLHGTKLKARRKGRAGRQDPKRPSGFADREPHTGPIVVDAGYLEVAQARVPAGFLDGQLRHSDSSVRGCVLVPQDPERAGAGVLLHG